MGSMDIIDHDKIVTTLGGEVQPGKCRCPIFGGKLSLNEKNGKILLKCWGRGCDNTSQIIPWLREHGAWGSPPPRTNGRDDQEQDTVRRVRRAQSILKAARKAKLSPDAYFKGRGINSVSDNVFLLPAKEAKRLKLKYANFPRVVVPVINRAGDEVGCHTIVLTRDGAKKLRVKDDVKFSYGLLLGNFIEIGKADPCQPLLVAEGYETAAITGHAAIATRGTELLKNVHLPECAEVIICADNDADNQSADAAKALAQGLTIPTRIAMPDGPDGYDWNDALVSDTSVEALKQSILNARLYERKAVVKPIESPTLKARREANAVKADKYISRDGSAPKTVSAEEVVAEAAKLDKVSYDREREALAESLGIRRTTLDEVVSECREALREREAEPPPLDIEALATSAHDIIASDDVLGMLTTHIGQAIAGEKKLVKLLYLVGTSRLFEKAMHAAVKGASAAGKSEVRKGTLNYFPPETVISFTVLSEKALLYFKDDFQHKILSMGEACGHDETKLQDYLLRTLMSENRIDYPVSIKRGSVIETITITKHGPVAFLVTTTRNALHPENETRMLSLEVNDTEEQTRRVLQKVAEVETVQPADLFSPGRAGASA